MPEIFRAAGRSGRKATRPSAWRGTFRERGYNGAWDRVSLAHRERYPFCAECLRLGRTAFADVVDHKHPVAHGGPLLADWNRWSLCHGHHNGWKAALEAHALATGQMDRIVFWCDTPEARPTVERGVLR